MSINYKVSGIIFALLLILSLAIVFLIPKDDTIRVCSRFDDEISCMRKVFEFARQQEDPNMCNLINEENQIERCKFQVIYNLVETDPSKCLNLEGYEIMCNSLYQDSLIRGYYEDE